MRAASYGFTVGGSVGLVMVEAGQPVDAAYFQSGKWEVEIANKLLAQAVSYGVGLTHRHPATGTLVASGLGWIH